MVDNIIKIKISLFFINIILDPHPPSPSPNGRGGEEGVRAC